MEGRSSMQIDRNSKRVEGHRGLADFLDGCTVWRISRSIHPDHQLAEVAGLFHLAENFLCLGPRKPFENGPQRGQRNGFFHLLEVATRANVDSANVHLLVQKHGQRERLCRPGQHADLSNRAAHAHRTQLARYGSHSTDFDNEIRPFATGLFEHPSIPFGVLAVVQPGMESHRARLFEFVVAA